MYTGSKEIILSIDTSSHNKLTVGLSLQDAKRIIEEEFDYRKSQGVLPLIARVIKENNLDFSKLTAIEVNVGPGSFTGLRVGVCIANTLGEILQIPINSQPVGLLVEPIYS
jgi:tRNA threonylcarbamoyladenosine biosynthesis protein TsaB